MLFYESLSFDPRHNLALEQYLFEQKCPSDACFMLWQNANTIVVGRYQNTAAEVNAAFVRQNGTHVVRRLSGGGAVYHDLGNLNFTFISSPANGSARKVDFSAFCEPVAQALRGFGVPAVVDGRNDITVHGRKFSGNAQYIRGGRVMHHGTLLFDSNLDTVQQALAPKPDKIASRGVGSVRARVTNLKELLPGHPPLDDFKAALKTVLLGQTAPQPITLTAEDDAAIAAIRTARYDQYDWNWGASPACSIQKSRRIAGCGEVSLYLEVQNGAIAAFTSRGDYFASTDDDALETALLGTPLEEGALKKALAGLEIGRYYQNLTLEGFLALLLE